MREIELTLGSSIEDAVKRIQLSKGKDVYASFNGRKLYPDTTLDEAYKLITGKSYDEFKQKEKEKQMEYERQEKEHAENIPNLVKLYSEKAMGIIKDETLQDWYDCLPIRFGDLYHGMEVKATLDLGILTKDNKFAEAYEVLISQGHSGMSHSLVMSMVDHFCHNGAEFVKYQKEQRV